MHKQKEFSLLSQYYDIIYSKKPYKRECIFLDRTIRRHIKSDNITLLDIGCGTAEHLLYLSRMGYRTTGIDASKQMLSCAEKKVAASKESIILRLGDATDIGMKEQFSVIISMFHVISYLTSNENLGKFFSEISSHLPHNGVCIFDCWYGPGILLDRPKTMTSCYQGNGIRIQRKKEPSLHTATNTVSIKHTFSITADKKDRGSFSETHTMRYFFYPEIEFLATAYGLRIAEWGTGEKSRLHSTLPFWNATFVLIKHS